MIGSETENAHVWQQESRPVAAQLSTQNKPNSLAIVWQEEREREHGTFQAKSLRV